MTSIRKIRLKDVGKITALWLDFMKEHDEIVLAENPSLKNFIKKDSNISKGYKEFLAKLVRSKNSTALIATDNKEIIGYLLIEIGKEIPIYKHKKIGHIYDLYVIPKYRAQKVSSKLKKEAFKWLKEKKIKFASIPLFTDNKKARSIYKKWGFTEYKLEMRKKIHT